MRIFLSEIIDEILGVPEGLLDISEEVYRGIVSNLEGDTTNVTLIPKRMNINGNFNISDYKFNTVEVEINANLNSDYDIEWLSMGVSGEMSTTKPYKRLSYVKNNKVYLIINLVCGYDKKWNDVADFFKGNKKKELISSIAHEFKHSYDNYKKGSDKASSIFKYVRVSSGNIGLPQLDKFTFYIYYTDAIENLVRPAEVASYLRNSNVTKANFLDILKETNVYKNLKEAQNISYDGMVKEIINDSRTVPSIKNFFEKKGENTDNLSDEEIVKKFLQYHFKHYKSALKADYANQVMRSNIAGNLFSFLKVPGREIDYNKKKAIEDFNREVERFSDSDFEKFYKYEEKKIHFEANRALKKVAKLYAYI